MLNLSNFPIFPTAFSNYTYADFSIRAFSQALSWGERYQNDLNLEIKSFRYRFIVLVYWF